jgi:hypothetical protein
MRTICVLAGGRGLLSQLSVTLLLSAIGLATPALGATLSVSKERGTVATDDPCPVPRTSERYLEIGKAIDCSESGDYVRIGPGHYTDLQDSGIDNGQAAVPV